jgi:hypothetical protein
MSGRTRDPLYHRLLRLRRHRPGPVVTFLCFEGSILASALLALADLLPWLSVLVVPAAVAAVVKLHDLVVQATPRPAIVSGSTPSRFVGIARVLGIARPLPRRSLVRGVAPMPRLPQ